MQKKLLVKGNTGQVSSAVYINHLVFAIRMSFTSSQSQTVQNNDINQSVILVNQSFS